MEEQKYKIYLQFENGTFVTIDNQTKTDAEKTFNSILSCLEEKQEAFSLTVWDVKDKNKLHEKLGINLVHLQFMSMKEQ
jgi:hypothetical protein